jgi:hypothetical protein
MSKLSQFCEAAANPIAQNSMLFSWLRDDAQRAELYRELRLAGFPVLRFKSMLRSSEEVWPPSPDVLNQDVYLLSRKEHVETALKHYSVAPYRELDSGGRFMLGLDDKQAHWKQNDAAWAALRFTSQEIEACAREAVRRASVLPLTHDGFDLPNDLAAPAAAHFMGLLFGFRDEAYGVLFQLAVGAYRRLVFQIVGRHFVPDSGLPPLNSADVEKLKQKLRDEIILASSRPQRDEPDWPGQPNESAIERLVRGYANPASEEMLVLTAGVIAGTVGNVSAAASIAIDYFFTCKDRDGRPLLEGAKEAARRDAGLLELLVMEALVRNPPAPFLARTSVDPSQIPRDEIVYFRYENRNVPVRGGAHVLLAMGAATKETLVFGGPPGTPEFMHRCIGKHLAVPLVCEIVRTVLLLPGLNRKIDSGNDQPVKLEKQYGAICKPYKLQLQRDRRLNQQPLHVVLPIKAPVKENAEKLRQITRMGASIVDDALNRRKHVHFAWFMLVENETHLAMMTVYDGNFDAYVEHFAVDVPLFDEQLKYLEGAPPTPTSKYPKEFVEWIREHNRPPLSGYFYSAYPLLTVGDVINAAESAR